MTPRILLLAALAAMTIAATPAAAEQPRPAQAKAEPKRDASRPAPKPAANPAPKGDARYGLWDKSWGTRPPAPTAIAAATAAPCAVACNRTAPALAHL